MMRRSCFIFFSLFYCSTIKVAVAACCIAPSVPVTVRENLLVWVEISAGATAKRGDRKKRTKRQQENHQRARNPMPQFPHRSKTSQAKHSQSNRKLIAPDGRFCGRLLLVLSALLVFTVSVTCVAPLPALMVAGLNV